MPTTKRRVNLIKAFVIFFTACALAAGCLKRGAETPVTITSSETPEPAKERNSTSNFSAFSHNIPEHKQFECVSCHRRESGPIQTAVKLELAGHDSCIGCHLNQFTDPKSAMCTICHQDMQSTPPSVRVFPARFLEGFNMKFDHAAHSRGEGRPAEGCVACHERAGPGKSIPAGVQAHTTCYTCHTPETKIGSCNTCHELAPYSRTPSSRYAFRAVFSHTDHGTPQGVSCNECHDVRAGAGQGRQVTLPFVNGHRKAAGYATSCHSCHNNVRAFGDADFANCKRCHTGSGFDMFP
ncbi:MAG: cytochrome c3 family protein [Acidobacteriota bacterium]